jgi:inulin fructotransferase (DFA-I-forming)
MRKTRGVIDFYQQYFAGGASSDALSGVVRGGITAIAPIILSGNARSENNCAMNLIAANHLLRDREPWPPMQTMTGRDDAYGFAYHRGRNNVTPIIFQLADGLLTAGKKPGDRRLGAGKNDWLFIRHHHRGSRSVEGSMRWRCRSCFGRKYIGVFVTSATI